MFFQSVSLGYSNRVEQDNFFIYDSVIGRNIKDYADEFIIYF